MQPTMPAWRCLAWLVLLSMLTEPAYAHSFGKLYTLPVPFWLYGWASAAALMLSFLCLAWFASLPKNMGDASVQAPAFHPLPPVAQQLLIVFQGVALMALLVCIVSGLYGTQDAYRNINMTLFWIVFVLGMAYFTVFAGDVFSLVSPWQTLTRAFANGRYAYPEKAGYWPALLLYMGFIWAELFASVTPWLLSVALLGYTLLTVLAIYCFGVRSWFRYGEFFSVMFRLLGKVAPLAYCHASPVSRAGWRWRRPFAGLLESRPGSLSEVVFILFMLSSTAFDGLHSTKTWALLFWQDGFAWLSPWLGSNIVTAYATLKPLYLAYQTLALLLSPWLYLAVFVSCLWLMKRVTGSAVSLLELTYWFSYSLLPIVVVYHFTHYFTLVLGQGPQLLTLLSDPLGLGWSLLATKVDRTAGFLLDMGWVWHVQVASMLFGHIASVYLAHQAARHLYPSPRAVWLSQIPLLILMMAFTVFGLWILAQPLDAAVLR